MLANKMTLPQGLEFLHVLSVEHMVHHALIAKSDATIPHDLVQPLYLENKGLHL